MREQAERNGDEERRRPSRGGRLLVRLAVAGTIIGFLWIWAYQLYNENPQPSDEAMIAHFERHRAGMEELVRRYRTFDAPIGQHHTWANVPDTRALMERTAVRHIGYIGGVWLPEPYTRETGKRVDALRIAAPGFSRYERYGTLTIRLEDIDYFRVWYKWGIVSKYFAYFPEPPRIEEGRLLLPADAEGIVRSWDRVLPSLNDPPDDWVGCLYRKIEPQWFIRLCRS